MDALEASANRAGNTDETCSIHCMRCTRRARVLRTASGVFQWLVLAAFTVSIGFAASRVGRVAERHDRAYECARAPLAAPSLERQQFAAREAALPAAQAEAPRVLVEPRHEEAPPLPASADLLPPPGDGEHVDQGGVPPSSAEGQATATPNDPEETEVQGAADQSASPAIELPLKPGIADVNGRLRKQLEAGRRSLRLGQFDEAERAFRRALAIRRTHPPALSGLAHVYLARGDIDRAKAFAERAVQQAPYQAPYHVVLGDVLRVASDPQGAESHYRLASRLNPSKPLDRAARSLPANPF